MSIVKALSRILPQRQVITDPLRRLAYGTDASFYRMIPEVVAVVEDEQQVQALLRVAQEQGRTVTFRAAGTSLSGQAITDSVLALIGDSFATCEISPDAATVRLGPGIIGGEVNARLAKFGRKIGPDPASINACKIGGIAANNASGMCCGTAQNSYRTLVGLRVVLADGSLLDTEDEASVVAFRQIHASLLGELEQLGVATRCDATLSARIRHKYKIKNTTGYSLNALIDDDWFGGHAWLPLSYHSPHRRRGSLQGQRAGILPNYRNCLPGRNSTQTTPCLCGRTTRPANTALGAGQARTPVNNAYVERRSGCLVD